MSFVCIATLLIGCASQTVGQRPPTSPDSTSPAAEELFEGTIRGWRIAPQAVIDAEGLGRNLNVDCTPKVAHSEARTELDFVLGYVPAGANSSVNTVKWMCDGKALSVVEQRDFDETVGSLDIERVLWGPNRAMPLDAPRSRVEFCAISGHPAVCVHPEDDVSGRGSSYIFVIEDDSMDPHATVLRISASEIPYADVLKVANELR